MKGGKEGTRGWGHAVRETAKKGSRFSADISGLWLTWNNMYFTLKHYEIFVGVFLAFFRV